MLHRVLEQRRILEAVIRSNPRSKTWTQTLPDSRDYQTQIQSNRLQGPESHR